jgi:hypothetical protein
VDDQHGNAPDVQAAYRVGDLKRPTDTDDAQPKLRPTLQVGRELPAHSQLIRGSDLRKLLRGQGFSFARTSIDLASPPRQTRLGAGCPKTGMRWGELIVRTVYAGPPTARGSASNGPGAAIPARSGLAPTGSQMPAPEAWSRRARRAATGSPSTTLTSASAETAGEPLTDK